MLSDFASLSSIEDREKLTIAVVARARYLEFETVSASVLVDRVSGVTDCDWIDNTPSGYRASFENPDNGRRDPVTQFCKRHNTPIAWDQATYVAAGQGAKWEEQARFGYSTGIAYALHLPGGRHFLLAVDRDKPLPLDRAEVMRMTAGLQLFAVHVVDAALRVLCQGSSQRLSPSISQRELECLRWTMEGKTAWELGRILGISEQTAAKHLNNAMHKLDCVSKHQAVVKALRLGLIS